MADELLFYGRSRLSDALDEQLRRMRKAVDAEPEGNLKQIDTDEWAEALSHHFAADCPVLRADDIWREEPKQITIDLSGDRMRYFRDEHSARNAPGERIVVHVPFEGDAAFFKLTPSQFSTSPPRGQVKGHDLLLTIDYPRDQAPNVDGPAQQFISQVDRHLGFAREDTETFNSALEQRAGEAIEARKQRVDNRNAELAKSSIPVRRPGDSGKKTYIADALVRRPAPSLPRTRADEKPPQLEPVLEEKVFEHILDVIRKQCLHIEQNPQTYVPMGEEDRRNVILSALSTHYDGITAETHNRAGHTDIIARYEGRNIFTCECKFWSGQKGFTDTINQLFGYAGWRDTKLAIVMFVREQGLVEIVGKAKETLAAHPQFVTWKDAASNTELRATVHWEGDRERLADLNVFLVHTPR